VSEAPDQLRTRVILLGASNLTRGISTVVETARLMLAGPLEVYAALGHGRSYGIDSRILGRTLPGIVPCGLWDAMNSNPVTNRYHENTGPRTFALITDIGNDVMYGVPPEEITQWVRECAERLAKHNAQVVITPPPIASVRTLRPWKYQVVKAVMFPTKRITFAQAISRSHELHDRIVDLAKQLNTPAIALPGDWYGFDPIHIRRPLWPHAWRTILSPWTEGSSSDELRVRPSFGRWLHLRTRTPHNWRLLGLSRGRSQPSGRLADGTQISLF
jgi:hypothetical protein